MLSAMITMALSFFALTSAAPLDTRATCHPQFGGPLGFNVSIINGGKEWSLTFLPPAAGRVVPRPKDITNAEFQVRHRPSDDTYAIKPSGSDDSAVGAVGGGKLRTSSFIPMSKTQEWNIRCTECGHPRQGIFSKGCTIKSVANNHQCVENDVSSSGSTLLLKLCSGGPKQKFQFGGV